MRPPHAGSHVLTHGPFTSSFISLGPKFHVDRVGFGFGDGTGTGLGVGLSLEPERCT